MSVSSTITPRGIIDDPPTASDGTPAKIRLTLEMYEKTKKLLEKPQ